MTLPAAHQKQPLVIDASPTTIARQIAGDLSRHGGDEVATVVSRVFTAVHAWSGDPAHQEPARLRFARSTALDPELRDAVAAVQIIVVRPASTALRGEAAAECQAIARWLDSHSALESALLFAHLASRLDPLGTEHAGEVARIARRLRRPAVAQAALLAALPLARSAGSAEAVLRLVLEMGKGAVTDQDYAGAARAFRIALRGARRTANPSLEGESLARLGLLRQLAGHDEEALGLFHEAVAAFGSGNPALVGVALEIASQWADEGQFRDAALLLQHLMNAPSPAARLEAGVALARVAGILGWEAAFERAWNAVLGCLPLVSDPRAQIDAWLSLARAAGLFQFWVRTAVAADEALRLAQFHRNAAATGESARIHAVVALPVVPDELAREVFPDLSAAFSLADAGDELSEGITPSPGVQALVEVFRVGLRQS